jgi:fatty-acyl-CoA synthase/long-chain acyl-CoA synthetase
MNEPQEPARTLGDRLVRGALFPLRVTKNSARLIRSALMGDFLTAYSLTQPDKLAMIDDRPDGTVLSLTFSELNAKSNQLANVLLDMGVRPGDSKVVWCGQNSIGLVLMINAARKLGVTAVPLNYRSVRNTYVTDHSDATTCTSMPSSRHVRSHPLSPKVEHYLVFDGEVPAGMTDIDTLIDAARAGEPEIPEGTEAGATMIYTSGTTGKPKGALRRGNSGAAQAAALMMHIGYTPDDVYIPTGPLYHSGPGGFLGAAQAMGQTAVLQRKFNAEDWLRLIEKYKVTSTFCAPTPVRMACNLPDEVKAKYDVSSMKRLIANAAPWSYALKLMYLAYFGRFVACTAASWA